VSARRIAAVLDAPAPVREPVRPRPLADGPVRVTLRGVRVRYQPDGPFALDGIDLDLPPGRRVALIGRNGAGKSTVASVLLRFVDLTAGTAILNGHDLASYAPPRGERCCSSPMTWTGSMKSTRSSSYGGEGSSSEAATPTSPGPGRPDVRPDNLEANDTQLRET
jgi:energy-coupling factor transporter ATP-binding protein EcfA2